MKLFRGGKTDSPSEKFVSETVGDDIPQDESFYVDYGIRIVCPRDIVKLSLPLDTVRNDSKMKWLREQVQQHGWNDPSPVTLHLELMTNGKFKVSSGGNHRTVLAKELGLEQIKASVSVHVPSELVPEGTKMVLRQLAELQSVTEAYYSAKSRFRQQHMLEIGVDLKNQIDKELSYVERILKSYGESRDQLLWAVVDELGWYRHKPSTIV